MKQVAQGFAVIGDSHIIHDEDNTRLTNKWDSLFALEQVVDYCLARNLSLVLAGDLYDKNLPPSRLTALVQAQLSRLLEQGIPVVGIQGNHDKDPEHPWFLHATGAQWLGPTPIDVGGHQLAGLDFSPSARIQENLALVKPCDGLVLHQALRQGLGFDGAWNCDLDWIDPSITSNVWIGDLHNVDSELWSKDKKVRAVYTLSQYLTAVDESENPSFLHVGPRQEGHQPYQRVPLKHRPILRLLVDSDESFDLALATTSEILASGSPGLPDNVSRPGLIVTYYLDVAGVSAAFRELTDNYRLASVLEKPLADRSRTFSTRKKFDAQEGLTLEKLVSETVDESDFQNFVFDLVRCQALPDVRTTIGAWRYKIIKGVA